MTKPVEHQILADLRRALLHLHKTLLDRERAAWDRAHGRTSPGELLQIVMTDPQFAWLRPISELIVRIDGALEMEAPDVTLDVETIAGQARHLFAAGAADVGEAAFGERYRAVLQESPDAVLAHRDVMAVLKIAPTSPEQIH